MKLSKTIALLAAGIAVAGLIANLGELKRYVRLFTI
jgi:hypothetical protein